MTHQRQLALETCEAKASRSEEKSTKWLPCDRITIGSRQISCDGPPHLFEHHDNSHITARPLPVIGG
jgi:hypothetical protein